VRPRVVDYLNQAVGTSLFSWLVPTPAFMYALAMLIGLLVFVTRSQRRTLSGYHALGAAIAAMAGGLIGARLFYLVLHVNRLFSNPGILFDVSGGTASWGGYIGGVLAFWLYLVIHRQPVRLYTDVLASCVALGPLIGRWSCFLNGCCFGKLTSVPWAIVYPHGSYAFAAQARQGLVDPLAASSLPLHPLPIYLSINGLALFLLFSWLWKQNKLPAGFLFWLYWAVYAFSRFFLEYFRDSNAVGSISIFSFPQIMTIVIFCLALIAISILFFTQKYSNVKMRHAGSE